MPSTFVYDLPDWRGAEGGRYESYCGKVESLPLNNGPAVFGLHPNAEIGYFSAASKSLWANLSDRQPRTAGGGGGVSRDEYLGGVVRDIAGKIPGPEDLVNLRKRLAATGAQLVTLRGLGYLLKLAPQGA